MPIFTLASHMVVPHQMSNQASMVSHMVNQTPPMMDIDQSSLTNSTIPLLPEVEKFYETNPSLRGTCTRLEQELDAALNDIKLRLDKSEEKLLDGKVEWWEEGHNSNMGAELKLSEINIAGTSEATHSILPPAEWIEEVNSSNENYVC